MLRRFCNIIVIVIGQLIVAVPAAGHDPIFFSEDQKTPEQGPFLPDGTISFALYGRLDGAGDTRGFQVAFADGDELLIELLVPDREPENLLAEGGLPIARVTASDGSSFDLVPEMREVFDEPFSGTSYLSLSKVRAAAQAGIYDVLVTSEMPARFTVAVGMTETFFTPVDRVENRIDSFQGIAAPLGDWYNARPSVEPSSPTETTSETVTETADSTPPSAPTTVVSAAANAVEGSETSELGRFESSNVAELPTAAVEDRNSLAGLVMGAVAAVIGLLTIGIVRHLDRPKRTHAAGANSAQP